MVRNIPEPIRRRRYTARGLKLSALCLHGRRRPVLRPIQNLIRKLLRVVHIV
jgi:hypothetical protein